MTTDSPSDSRSGLPLIQGRALPHTPSLHLCLVVAIALLLLLRTPLHTLSPPVLFEDGAVLLAHYLNRQAGEPFFIDYAGYVSVGPNLLAYISSLLPASWIPHSLLALATAFNAAAISVFFLPRFRRVLAHDGLRLAVCLLIVLMPWGNSPLLRSVSYSFWVGLMSSFLLLAVPTERTKWPEFVYLAINACSSPLAITLLPLMMIRVIAAKSAGHAFLALLTVAYAAGVIFGFPGEWAAPSTMHSPSGTSTLWSAAVQTAPALLDRIFFEPVFTNWLRVRLNFGGFHWIVLAAGSLVAILALAPVWLVESLRNRARHNRAFLLWVCYMVLALTGMSLYARFGTGTGYDYRDAFHHRYFWIQVCLAAFSLASIYGPDLVNSPAMRKLTMVLLIPAVVGGGYLDAFEFNIGVERGESTRAFFKQFDHCKREPDHCELPLILDLGNETFYLTIKQVR